MDQKCATLCVTQTTTRNNERKRECCIRELVFHSLSVCLSVCLSIKHTRPSNPLGSGGRGYMRSQVGTGTLSLGTEQRISGRRAMDLSGPLSRLATLQLSTDVNVSAGGLHGIRHCLTVQSPLWPHRLPLELMYVFPSRRTSLHFFVFILSALAICIFLFTFIPLLCTLTESSQQWDGLRAAGEKKPFKPFYK